VTKVIRGNPQEDAHKRTAVVLDPVRLPECGRFIFSAYCKESILSEDHLNCLDRERSAAKLWKCSTVSLVRWGWRG
jgi:hypothetical protein